jgi:putative copper resistance protein D
MGHGAASDGPLGWLHLGADILHNLTAAGWIGALVLFWIATRRRPPSIISLRNLQTSLAGFSGMGSAFVATLLATGIINSAFLVGWDLARALATPYGKLLAVKLVLFAAMLGFAALNRYCHTPILANALNPAAETQPDLLALRQTIRTETLAGFSILALVAILGTLMPVIGP